MEDEELERGRSLVQEREKLRRENRKQRKSRYRDPACVSARLRAHAYVCAGSLVRKQERARVRMYTDASLHSREFACLCLVRNLYLCFICMF